MAEQPESCIGEYHLEFLEGLAAASPPGALVEIGVYKGGSAVRLARVARAQGRKLYLYDTFTGIPCKDAEMGDSHNIGDFHDTSLDAVREAIPDAIFCVGVFPDTLIDMGPVAFVHADCDQYDSVKAVCERMPPLMVDGSRIYFDDYGCLKGATRAVDEAFGSDKEIVAAGKALYTVRGKP